MRSNIEPALAEVKAKLAAYEALSLQVGPQRGSGGGREAGGNKVLVTQGGGGGGGNGKVPEPETVSLQGGWGGEKKAVTQGGERSY